MEQHQEKWRFPAAVYAAWMLYLLLYRKQDLAPLPYSALLKEHFNPIPLRTIQLFWRCFLPPYRPQLIQRAVINLLGNVILFLPLGFLPPLLSEKFHSLSKTLLLAAGIMVVIELAQMFFLVGTCDIDDLILNLAGAAIGYGLFKYAKNKQR